MTKKDRMMKIHNALNACKYIDKHLRIKVSGVFVDKISDADLNKVSDLLYDISAIVGKEN